MVDFFPRFFDLFELFGLITMMIGVINGREIYFLSLNFFFSA